MFIKQLTILEHMVQAIVDANLLIPPSCYLGEASCHEGIGPKNVHVVRCVLMETVSGNKSYCLT